MIDGRAEIDPHSETWQAIRAHIAIAIDANRRICETPETPMAETENARGALSVLRGLLKLGGDDVAKH